MPTQHCDCGARYRFPESAVGKRAKCKKCGSILTLRAGLEDGTLALAHEVPTPGVESPLSVQVSIPEQGQIYTPPARPEPVSRETTDVSAAIPRKRGYGSDVLWTFLFPANPASLITFLVIWVVLTVAPLATFVPLIGFFLGWIVAGWFAAFQFDVLGSTAAGEDDIPQPRFESGMVADLLAALGKWVGSWLLVMAPAIIYLMTLLSDGTLVGGDVVMLLLSGVPEMLQASTDLPVFGLLVCAGLFIWPMVVLCIALDSFNVIYRVDLVAVTIFRTLPLYLLTLVFVFGAVALEYGINSAALSRAVSQVGAGGPPGIGGLVGAGLVLHIVATGTEVYMGIVVMRLIGLYYVHGKEKFAWSWE